jgi:hypothetical protein
MNNLLKESSQRWLKMRVAVLFSLALAVLALATPVRAAVDSFRFTMIRSPGVVAARVLPQASATVNLESAGPVEIMQVRVTGLPPLTDFDLFVIQVPNMPFGLAWYQGDIETDAKGNGFGQFIGRFSIETFIVAPGIAAAPNVHTALPFKDALTNPVTGPVHTYHLGLWFNSPADAAKAGLAATVTPFNGDHHAGVQVLNTANFPVAAGPLKQIHP